MRKWLALAPYHFVRLFTGLWFLYAGLNFFLYPDNQRLGLVPASHDFTVALISSGLFTWIKAIEVVLAITLLMHSLMPVTVIALVPINFVIVYYNWVLEPHTGTFIAGGLTFAFTAYLAWCWREWFWPLLTWRGTPQPGFAPRFTTIRHQGETDQ